MVSMFILSPHGFHVRKWYMWFASRSVIDQLWILFLFLFWKFANVKKSTLELIWDSLDLRKWFLWHFYTFPSGAKNFLNVIRCEVRATWSWLSQIVNIKACTKEIVPKSSYISSSIHVCCWYSCKMTQLIGSPLQVALTSQWMTLRKFYAPLENV